MAWTPRERLLAALNHEEPDRVPIDFGGSEFTTITPLAYERLKAHMGVTEPTKMMSIIHSAVHPDETILQRFQVDVRNVIAGPYHGSPHEHWAGPNTYYDIFNVRWDRTEGTEDTHFLHTDGPFYKRMTIDDIEALEWPDPKNAGMLTGLKERVAEIKRLGDYAIMLYLPGGVIHRGYAMRGFETYLKDVYKNRPALQLLQTKLCDFWVGCAETIIAEVGPENIDNIFFGEDLGTQDGCMYDPKTIYPMLFKPHHRRMVETVKSLTRGKAKVTFHCCGSAYHFIDHLIDIGVDALNPVQVTAKNMEPERLKEEFGDRICFWGGINTQNILPFGTPQEVAEETRRIIGILGKGGGYVLNSVHNIQAEVPPANVVAMFETGCAHRYREPVPA
jgi:uroporphyrinogen decarboxylase